MDAGQEQLLDLTSVEMVAERTGWWKRASVKDALHIVGAGALMFGGVVFSLMLGSPQFRPVRRLAELPGTVISAPPTSQETFRVANILKRYTKDTTTADRIAGAIVDQGTQRNLDPALLVGVLLTEDATLDTMARSNVGARGLMQVMPFHSGKWGCSSSNLFSVESNICHGASVLEDAVQNAPNIRVALLRYNGCVRGTNTRNCHAYPDRVMRTANRTTAQLLAMAE